MEHLVDSLDLVHSCQLNLKAVLKELIDNNEKILLEDCKYCISALEDFADRINKKLNH